MNIRSIVLAGLLAWLCLGARAQNVGGGPLLAGVASQIDGDSWGGYNKLGFLVGGYAFYDFNDRISLSPEITIGKRGSREVEDGYEQYSLSFIDVPVLLRYRLLGDPNAQNLLAEAGPSANILFDANGGFGTQKIDLMPRFHKFNISANLGGTFFINRTIGIFGRWTYALTNMNKDANVFRRYWRCHFITLGVRFAFK